MHTTEALSPIYTEVTGCTYYVGLGNGGTTVGFTRDFHSKTGAFVKLWEGDMVYLELGSATGDRGQHHEVLSHRVIDRDEFDRLNGIAALRAELGWK